MITEVTTYIDHSGHHSVPLSHIPECKVIMFKDLIDDSTVVIQAQSVQHDWDESVSQEVFVVLKCVGNNVVVVHH